MDREKTALEAKIQQAERPVVVLRRCFTSTDHNPGDIIPFAGPLWEGTVRELTDDERDELDARRRQAKAEFGDEAPPSEQKVSVRSEVILEALGRLDPENDQDWLESGQPAMAAVNRELLKMGATPDTSSRAEVRSIAPDFVRPVNVPVGAGSETEPLAPVGMAPIEGGF